MFGPIFLNIIDNFIHKKVSSTSSEASHRLQKIVDNKRKDCSQVLWTYRAVLLKTGLLILTDRSTTNIRADECGWKQLSLRHVSRKRSCR